jgi:hypothetical protein
MQARPAAIDACMVQGLSGQGGLVSTTSPGVFLQGLMVYGEEGVIVHNQELDEAIIREVRTRLVIPFVSLLGSG